MKKQKLIDIIRCKINYHKCDCGQITYDGFDMSGFDTAFFNNMELLNRFKSYLQPDGEYRRQHIWIPTFWKGSGELVRIESLDNAEFYPETIEIGGWTTEEILLKLLWLNNPDLKK